MSNVIDLDANRPHLTIPGRRAVHVLPVSLLREVANGDRGIEDIEDYLDILPAIIGDYLAGLGVEDVRPSL